MSPLARLFAVPLLALSLTPAVAETQTPLVAPSWLAARLSEPKLVVLDIRSGDNAAGRKAFEAGHVPGARHADYAGAGWREAHEGTQVYLPSPERFEAVVGGLGIDNESKVVIVHAGDTTSDFGAAARVYWSFKVMGHTAVSILDGGHRSWVASGGALETGPGRSFAAARFAARYDASLRADATDVEKARTGQATLVDSRPADFFTGRTAHKAVKASGHIPGAVNLPHDTGFTPAGSFAGRNALDAVYAGVSADGETISYCNTGHWAATNWFVLSELLGRKNVRLYDGSMYDYAKDGARPVATPISR